MPVEFKTALSTNVSLVVMSYRYFGASVMVQCDDGSLIMPFAHLIGKYCFLPFVSRELAFEKPHPRLQVRMTG